MTQRRTFPFVSIAVLLVAASSAQAREPDQVDPIARSTGHRPHAGDAPQFLGKDRSPSTAGTAGSPASTPSSTSRGSTRTRASTGRAIRSRCGHGRWSAARRGTNQTTVIGAPIIPVSIDMRNADGSPRYVNGVRLYMDATQYVWPVIDSPIFRPIKWATSLIPTQYLDALMRAEFWRGAGDGDFDRGDHVSELWHTLLLPVPRTPRVMKLTAGSYQFALNDDGTCCAFVLVDSNYFGNALFPATADDTTTPIGAAEHAREMTTGVVVFPTHEPIVTCMHLALGRRLEARAITVWSRRVAAQHQLRDVRIRASAGRRRRHGIPFVTSRPADPRTPLPTARADEAGARRRALSSPAR